MKLVADTHTHTIASGHAFSTVTENVMEAGRMGMRFLCITDHTRAIPGAPEDVYFESQLSSLPESLNGVFLVRGCEANIMGEDGRLDVGNALLNRLDWVIASMHTLAFKPMDREAIPTRGWLSPQIQRWMCWVIWAMGGSPLILSR
jgi:putative hydrolase